MMRNKVLKALFFFWHYFTMFIYFISDYLLIILTNNVTIMNVNSFLIWKIMAQVKKEKLKQDIIKASVNLFYLRGYNSTSIKDIANNLNISVGNIYNYFKCKEEIFNEIINDDLLQKMYELIKTRSSIIFKKELDLEVTAEEEIWLKDTFYKFLIENYKQCTILKKNLEFVPNIKNKIHKMIDELICFKKQLISEYFKQDFNDGLTWLSYSIFMSNLELYTKILENEFTTSKEKINKLSLLDLYHEEGMKAILNKLTEKLKWKNFKL